MSNAHQNTFTKMLRIMDEWERVAAELDASPGTYSRPSSYRWHPLGSSASACADAVNGYKDPDAAIVTEFELVEFLLLGFEDHCRAKLIFRQEATRPHIQANVCPPRPREASSIPERRFGAQPLKIHPAKSEGESQARQGGIRFDRG